jgi:hypothetical protein
MTTFELSNHIIILIFISIIIIIIIIIITVFYGLFTAFFNT